MVYRPSPRADLLLRTLAEAAAADGGRLTVLSLVVQEPEKTGCCDTRSVMWNDVLRGIAREDLGPGPRPRAGEVLARARAVSAPWRGDACGARVPCP